ncbi:unnamed protein product [Fraxinus pennsylvanica]|uniref:Uncharacterized protein n=1 Tax=Fraxinus pennsylvanica TaxID=56036 RepID=A0AAD2DI42_9LAMI|nr:unnamed protein product [Fraxinus pennsylvanica]
MDSNSGCREDLVSHRQIFEELTLFNTQPKCEDFPVGFSSFSTVSRSLDASSSNPFSGFSADPFQASCTGKKFQQNQFAKDGTEAHVHGLQTRNFLDLNSEASLKRTEQCRINEPLELNLCLVLDNELERRTHSENKIEKRIQMKSETRVDKKPSIIKGPWTPEEDRIRANRGASDSKGCGEDLVSHRQILEELTLFKTQPKCEDFPVGFSSFSTVSRRSLDASSSNPFSGFSADPFQASCTGKKFQQNQFAKDGAEAHVHGLQTRNFLGSLKRTEQCRINEPLELNLCLVLDNELERRTHSENKIEKTIQRKSETRVDKKPSIIKGPWTPEEDRLLMELVEKHGVRKWCVIAWKFLGRTGKQCRERWHNHIKPDIKKDKWSQEEDERLIEAHIEVGNRWAEIARRLPRRSENTIKNHWHATKRRLLSHKGNNLKFNTPLQNYIKSVISSSDYIVSLGNS